MKHRLQIAVLAAGLSRRLGRPKVLTRVHGESLLRRVLRIAAPLSDAPILVVVPAQPLRHSCEARGIRARLLPNAHRAEGISSSVRLALKNSLPGRAVLLLPADLTELSLQDLQRLLRRWHSSPQSIVASRFGERGGIPLVLPRRFFKGADTLQGDTGLKSLLATSASHLQLMDMPSALKDMDTPAELALARASFRTLRR